MGRHGIELQLLCCCYSLLTVRGKIKLIFYRRKKKFYSKLETKLHVESRLKLYTLGGVWYSYRLMLSRGNELADVRRCTVIGKIFLTVPDFKLSPCSECCVLSSG